MPEHFYVYPEYLLASTSRSLGRRVLRMEAKGEVTLEEIVRAARALGHTAESEAEKSYPRQFYRYRGRVKVSKRKGVTKGKFLKALAAELEKTRAAIEKA